MTRPLARRLDGDDDRGAVLPMVAGLLVVLLTMAAFAVDLGMQRVVARDAQASADTIALDMARHLDGRTKAEVQAAISAGPLATSVARSTGTNLGTVGGVTAEPGTLDGGGRFVSIAAGAVPDHILVTVPGSVDFAFAPVIGQNSGSATRSAVAMADRSACIRLGSIALGLDTASSPLLGILNPLLGANLSVLSYEGLVGASVSLADLLTDLGLDINAGTPEQLVATQVELEDLALAAADVLEREGDTANATVLRQLAASVVPLPPIALGDLLALEGAARSALDTQVNVFDLISGSAFIANGTNAIAVPGLNLTVPGVTNLAVSLTVIQKPIVACGDAVAETSQVQLRVTGNLLQIGIPPLTTVNGPIDLRLDLATARGRVNDIDCTQNPPQSITVDVFDKTLASLRTSLSVRVSVLGLGLRVADVAAQSFSTAGADTTVTIDTSSFGPDGLSAPVRAGSGTIGLGALDVTNLTLLGLNLGGLAGSLTTIVGALETAVLNTVAPLLGLSIADADVWALDAPTCLHPRLVG